MATGFPQHVIANAEKEANCQCYDKYMHTFYILKKL